MADKSQLEYLKMGVGAWNNWRKAGDFRRRIDLSGANLSGINLSGANFSGANLSGANLSRTGLSHAHLEEANLRGADLSCAYLNEANLHQAHLIEVDLSHANLMLADLSSADLSEANLSEADLSEANLSEANFMAACLRTAHLIGANLRRANLNSVDLRYAYLRGANLSDANLQAANVSGAKLIGAALNGANLNEANLNGANLSRTQVLRATFLNTTLTGACIGDWQIGSSTKLANITCDYIFRTMDSRGKFSGRLPVAEDSFFAPGEFTRRFQILASALETIDLTFTEGIDWQAFFQSFQEVCREHPTENLSILSMERKGQAFVIRIESSARADQATIETDMKRLYRLRVMALEAQYEEKLKLQGVQIEEARRAIELEKQEKASLVGIMATMAENQGSNFDLRGANIGNVVGTAQSGSQVQSVLHNYAPEQHHNVAAAAQEIHSLLERLSASYPVVEVPVQAVEQIKKNPQMKERVLGALKGGGKTAIEKLVDHPAVSIVLAAIEGASKPD
ncbi:MAG: pentapeptide repeat-containing protein [Cyanobacteria bacterium P01_D01_bin.1]